LQLPSHGLKSRCLLLDRGWICCYWSLEKNGNDWTWNLFYKGTAFLTNLLETSDLAQEVRVTNGSSGVLLLVRLTLHCFCNKRICKE